MLADMKKPRASRDVPPNLTSQPTSERKQKIAYIMSRFPKLTETFVLFEMLALEESGISVELYPLLREKSAVIHPEAENFVKRAHYQPFLSQQVLRAQASLLTHTAGSYLETLWTLIRANLGSYRFLTGGLGIFPKSVYFANLMQEHDITHIHAHFASFPAASAYIINQLTGIPFSFTAHGSDLHRDRHMLKEKVHAAHFVATVSHYNKRVILEECGDRYRNKVHVIHCGIDTEVFSQYPPTSETKLMLNSNNNTNHLFRILCIGTLHEVKGQTYLIEACRLLHARHIPITCQFIGDGPDRDTLQSQIERANLTEHIQLLGHQTRDEVARRLQQADALVAPSVPTNIGRREGIPVVLMEAMGTGLPVVASNLSGIPELVTNQVTGLLTPPRDAVAIADALQHLYDDPALRLRLGTAGRAKVIAEFDLRQNVAQLASHFQSEAIQ